MKIKNPFEKIPVYSDGVSIGSWTYESRWSICFNERPIFCSVFIMLLGILMGALAAFLF